MADLNISILQHLRPVASDLYDLTLSIIDLLTIRCRSDAIIIVSQKAQHLKNAEWVAYRL